MSTHRALSQNGQARGHTAGIRTINLFRREDIFSTPGIGRPTAIREILSGPVEGINNKARVVTRRSFGIKSPQALWQRLVLDINLAVEATGYTLERIKTLTRGIKAKFCGYYT